MGTTVSRTEWDMAYEILSEAQKRLVLELAWNILPSEPPEPGDLEAHKRAIEEYRRGDYVSFSSVAELAAHFGIDLDDAE
jgi:hypothetical protein